MEQQSKNNQSANIQSVTGKNVSTNQGTLGTVANKHKAPTVKPASKYKPDYSGDDAKKQLLEAHTKEVEQEIDNIVNNAQMYGAVKVGENVVIDLKKAVKNGIHIYGMDVNREHGKDEQKTGASLFEDGAQMFLTVITCKVAKLYGIGIKHLTNDKEQGHEPQDEDLVLIDGHGRIDFLMQYDVDEWNVIYAHFPAKDRLGNYNICKAMEAINVNLKAWTTSNFVQKRILQEGSNAHEGWKRINDLLNRGYNYQAACQLTTLAKDRVAKKEVVNGEDNDIFTNYGDAIKVSEALIKCFGEGADNVVKTKEFTKKVSILWQTLVKKFGNDKATEYFLDFLKGLPQDKVIEIKNAKKTADGVSKDENRKKILQKEFDNFVKSHNIAIKTKNGD